MNPNQQTSGFAAAIILASDSFDEGRYNKPWGGGDWDSFNKGQNERRWNERINEDLNRRRSGNTNWGGNNSGGSGNGCGSLILMLLGLTIAFYFLKIIIPSAIAALISGSLMITIVKRILPPFSTISFKEAYKASFLTGFTYLILVVVFALVQVWFYPNLTGSYEQVSETAVLKYLYFHQYNLLSFVNLLEFHLLCILLSAVTLSLKMKGYFNRLVAYGHAILVTTSVILPSILVTLYIILPHMIKFYRQIAISL